MKKEDKELLLKDLCARLPYNVIVHIHDLDVVDYDNYLCEDTLAKMRANQITLKPYLRPLSSMTEEELVELNCLCYHNISIQDDSLCGYICGVEIVDVQDFLLRYHFDFMELIPRGLAIAVTEENNPYDTKEE